MCCPHGIYDLVCRVGLSFLPKRWRASRPSNNWGTRINNLNEVKTHWKHVCRALTLYCIAVFACCTLLRLPRRLGLIVSVFFGRITVLIVPDACFPVSGLMRYWALVAASVHFEKTFYTKQLLNHAFVAASWGYNHLTDGWVWSSASYKKLSLV